MMEEAGILLIAVAMVLMIVPPVHLTMTRSRTGGDTSPPLLSD